MFLNTMCFTQHLAKTVQDLTDVIKMNYTTKIQLENHFSR